MRFFEWNVQVWIVPSLSLVKRSEHRDLQFFLITYIGELTAISQLLLQQVIVAVKLTLYREV